MVVQLWIPLYSNEPPKNKKIRTWSQYTTYCPQKLKGNSQLIDHIHTKNCPKWKWLTGQLRRIFLLLIWSSPFNHFYLIIGWKSLTGEDQINRRNSLPLLVIILWGNFMCEYGRSIVNFTLETNGFYQNSLLHIHFGVDVESSYMNWCSTFIQSILMSHLNHDFTSCTCCFKWHFRQNYIFIHALLQNVFLMYPFVQS